MEHVAQALRISEKVADTLPVPFLSSVISIALQIVEAAEVRPFCRSGFCVSSLSNRLSGQHAKQIRKKCQKLAERSARLALAVVDVVQEAPHDVAVDKLTTDHLAALLWCAHRDQIAPVFR